MKLYVNREYVVFENNTGFITFDCTDSITVLLDKAKRCLDKDFYSKENYNKIVLLILNQRGI